MKIGFVSDLHLNVNGKSVESAAEVLHDISSEREVDRLFIGGDTSDFYLDSLRLAEELTAKGTETYTIFGNHEYFSITYNDALLLDNDRYISNSVFELSDNTALVSIDGFFDYSFVLEVNNKHTKDIPSSKALINEMNAESSAIRRPSIGNFSEVFESMSENLVSLLEEVSLEYENIFMMLHYAPSEEFVIFKDDDVVWNSRNSFMGSKRYKEIAEEYNVSKVIFGHTHNLIEEKINGVNYYCNSVGYKDNQFHESFDDRVERVFRTFEL